VSTVLDVLAELDLSAIPRLTVYNKVDRLEALERGAVERAARGAPLVSALDRESLRPLIAAVASELGSKWEASARGPDLSPA
jgi:50S ribosomal subunit-associated GTPase HflX